MVEVKVPEVGESISEVQIGQWLKSEGEWVAAGEDLVDIETEKASVQIPSPESGFVRGIRIQAEDFANVGDIIAEIEPAEKPAGGTSEQPPAASSTPTSSTPAPAAVAPPAGGGSDGSAGLGGQHAPTAGQSSGFVMPAAQRMMDENRIGPGQVIGSGPGG